MSLRSESKEVARDLDLAAVRAMNLPSDEAIRVLGNVESEILSRRGWPEALKLEIKRRAVEWKFKLLSERNEERELVERLYSDVQSLGCSSLENEATIVIEYAQYCIRQSRYGDANRVLLGLCAKLDRAIATDNMLVHRHLKEVVEKMLSGRNASSTE